MPNRVRVIVLAIGLTVWACLAASQEVHPTLEQQPIAEPGQEESAANGESTGSAEPQPTVDYLPALQAIESAIRDTIPEEDGAEAQRQEQHEIADLQAQEDMALWAEGMFWATVSTVVLTFAALIAIIRTLHHTRRAADYAADVAEEAKKTTGAAVEANKITRNMSITDQRAWLEIVNVEMIGDEEGADEDALFVIKVTVKNHGKSPAYRTQFYPRLVQLPDPIVVQHAYDDVVRKPFKIPLWPHELVVFPGQTEKATGQVFFAADFFAKDGPVDQGLTAWLVVSVEYDSVDENTRHETGIVLRVFPYVADLRARTSTPRLAGKTDMFPPWAT